MTVVGVVLVFLSLVASTKNGATDPFGGWFLDMKGHDDCCLWVSVCRLNSATGQDHSSRFLLLLPLSTQLRQLISMVLLLLLLQGSLFVSLMAEILQKCQESVLAWLIAQHASIVWVKFERGFVHAARTSSTQNQE